MPRDLWVTVGRGGTGERLRLGMVGCGAIARWHLEAIGRAAIRTDVTAVVDVLPERAQALASATGAAPYADLEEALAADAFDAALVRGSPRSS